MTGLIVHEWIAKSGGSENVLEEIAQAFPDADIQCLWTDAPERLSDRNVRETWLARTPIRKSKALALPFTVPTWRSIKAQRDYEWMLVSSHLFAHHIKLRGDSAQTPKFVYAHSPARYIWTPEFDERGASKAIRAVAPIFQRIDRTRAREPIAIAANSEFVRKRIADTWQRDSVVIHPPVNVDNIMRVDDWQSRLTDEERSLLDDLPEQFVLGASRFIPYKRLDLVIAAAEKAGIPVVIAGRGPDEQLLRARASESRVPARIVLSPSDSLLWALYQRASVLVFPAIEDFGIVPVEAQVLNTPVVVGPVGGQLETIADGKTGVIAASFEPSDLAVAIEKAMALPEFDGVEHCAQFRSEVFHDRIREFVR